MNLKSIGYNLISFVKAKGPKIFYHEIGIAYKPDVFTLLDKELIDLDEVANIYKDAKGFKKHNQAMFAMLGHNKSKEMLVIGNCHLYYNPE